MDLSDNADLRWLSELIRDIRSAAPDHDPLMVGAMARDLLLQYGGGLLIQRATTDVDLAFTVANWDEFADNRVCRYAGRPVWRVIRAIGCLAAQAIEDSPIQFALTVLAPQPQCIYCPLAVAFELDGAG